jgi:chaperonin GroEL
MIVKEVNLGQEGRDRLMKGIKIGYDAVKSTIGPAGSTAIIEDESIVGGCKISKDGVALINSINLLDPIEDLGLKIVREASRRTAVAGGDGTTTSFLLSYAILNELNKLFESNPKINKTEVLREIQNVAEKIDSELVKRSKKVSGKTLRNVATISANNNPKIGKLVADSYKGSDIVNLEHSKTFNTFLESYDGIKIDRGFSSKFFVNNVKTNEAQYSDVFILITDIEIASVQAIEPIIKAICMEQNKPLLIIGEISAPVMATINLNVQRGNIKFANIIPPSFGLKKENILSDLAVATGGTFYSQMTGDHLGIVTMDGLGRANKIIIGQDKSIIIPNERSSDKLDNHIKELKESIKLTVSEQEIKFINERIANISGSISTIYVGADTDIEAKESYDLIEDSILACKSAIEEGILPGSVGLIKSIHSVDSKIEVKREEESLAISVLKSAAEYPITCIFENADKNSIEIIDNILRNENFNFGFNVKADTYGDMLSMGVADPTKVVRNVLKNAVSVATTIASTNCIISNIRA